jgi:hypothetical protein
MLHFLSGRTASEALFPLVSQRVVLLQRTLCITDMNTKVTEIP